MSLNDEGATIMPRLFSALAFEMLIFNDFELQNRKNLSKGGVFFGYGVCFAKNYVYLCAI